MNLWLFGHVVLNLWQLLIMKFVFIRNTMTIANRSVNVHRSFGKFLHTISKKRNHLYECKKNIIKKKKLNCRLEKVYWAVPYTSRTLILLFFLQQEGNMLVQQDNAYSHAACDTQHALHDDVWQLPWPTWSPKLVTYWTAHQSFR